MQEKIVEIVIVWWINYLCLICQRKGIDNMWIQPSSL